MAKKKLIEFTNTKAIRVGKGINTLRKRCGYSIEQLAEKAGIQGNYLSLLEEGHEPEVAPEILERIAQALEICRRGTIHDKDQLINLFLYTTKDEPPRLL